MTQENQENQENQEQVDIRRRRFLLGATCVVGAAGAACAAIPFLSSWQPSAKAKAAGAPVRVNISKLEPGQQIIAEWRGKPVFLVRRTPAMVERLNQENKRILDPESKNSDQPNYARNAHRSRKPDLLVLVGLCTHLGCSPKYLPEVVPKDFDPGWQGGYHCPCHGSRFDLAGRVYKGVPAPVNLVVPPYMYENDSVITIGKDKDEENV
ncbi:MAG: ubiquinol-cytochrome c reductase iron-sulfur subunit [Kistimonas sp.]|nr:ubiquinol-cytochrome c reductase iron-sulfur subunit [Kistimonas sp.]